MPQDTVTPIDVVVPGQRRQTPVQSAGGINLGDPAQIDWGRLGTAFQLSPEELEQIQIPEPGQSRSLEERLQALRPQMTVGGMRLQLEDNGISGSYRW